MPKDYFLRLRNCSDHPSGNFGLLKRFPSAGQTVFCFEKPVTVLRVIKSECCAVIDRQQIEDGKGETCIGIEWLTPMPTKKPEADKRIGGGA